MQVVLGRSRQCTIASLFLSVVCVVLLIQELQYENASLKAKLAELFAVQKCDREASDRKLG